MSTITDADVEAAACGIFQTFWPSGYWGNQKGSDRERYLQAARAALAAIPDPRAARMSERDSAVFVGAILDAPEPNEALKAAASRHKDHELSCGHTPAEVADLCASLAHSADHGWTNNYTEIADIARRAEEAIRWLLGQARPRAAGFAEGFDAAKRQALTTAAFWGANDEVLDAIDAIAALKPEDQG